MVKTPSQMSCIPCCAFISPLVSSRQIRQICVVCRSENHFRNLDEHNSGNGGREQGIWRDGGNLLLFSVFGTGTVVFQIAIPWNLLKTSSSSYHVPHSVQSIQLRKKHLWSLQKEKGPKLFLVKKMS